MKSRRSMAAAVAIALALAPIIDLALTIDAAQAQGHRWQRGQTLPAEVLRSGPNVDYAAQRLRQPPAGYGWFSLDGQLVLASLSSGLILEVVQ
jgi:Ni/Co efflux regulator RcnB